MNNTKPDDSLGFLISKAHQFMKNHFTRLLKANQLDVTVEQWALVNIVCNAPGVSQSEISAITRTDKTSITRMLDLLEKKGYIVRKNDRHDRRMYRIHATTKGVKMVAAVAPLAEEVNRLSQSGLSHKEVRLLKTMLKRVRSNIEKET